MTSSLQLAGGTASGTCAESFGVCCVLTMGCGGTSSTNNTYLVQDSTNAAKTCSYTICPSNTDICKIRIDFETAVLSPASSTAGTVGLCTDDTLTVSSPGGTNPPLLCGTLTGHHLYLDASSSCLVENENHAAFVLLSWSMNYLKHIYVLT